MVRTGVLALGLLGGCLRAQGTAEMPEPPEPTPTLEVGPRGEVQPIVHATGHATGDASDDAAAEADDFGPDKETITVTIRNECHRVVRLYLGHEPQPGISTFITMNGGSQSSMPMMPGDELWILDDAEEPVARARVERGSREFAVDASCVELQAR
ncbi:hypothetical protein [Paraliomyxa miuraensis]|uniref:hypothetical protein n=1 Tax=Paraliomyxa miuraensis TaxID=376150 RepID=UPI00224F487A|nr:hypothetical protein [Paraliomyxa miuraensis]MCX4246422.1 hypothetical protein [Paraliomyxa miuraensis]